MPYKAKEQLEEQMKEIMAKKERVANLKAQFQEQGIMPKKPLPPYWLFQGSPEVFEEAVRALQDEGESVTLPKVIKKFGISQGSWMFIRVDDEGSLTIRDRFEKLLILV